MIGFLIAWWFLSRQKWGEKADTLNAKWETKIKDLEKNYELKIEKLDKESKIKIEQLIKNWQVKYIQDIEELKRLFKESEKIIKLKSVSSSRRSLVGKFVEKFVPFLSSVKYAPADMHFLGQPIDYIVFEGAKDDKIEKVVFLEVKTGESKLNKREKSLKETIDRKKVAWKELRVDTESEKTPDKQITEEETSIKELYNRIDDKLKTVRGVETASFKTDFIKGEEEPEEEQGEEENEEYEVGCSKCGEVFNVVLDEGDDLEEGIIVICPHCNKTVKITEDDT